MLRCNLGGVFVSEYDIKRYANFVGTYGRMFLRNL
jgi:hypothetical protein